MIKKNSWQFGAILGIIIPAVIFGIAAGIIKIFGIDNSESATGLFKYFKYSNLVLLSVAFNLLPFRYYMVNCKFDKTGRGILIITIIYTVLFFYLY